jgi:hypothetical protein
MATAADQFVNRLMSDFPHDIPTGELDPGQCRAVDLSTVRIHFAK